MKANRGARRLADDGAGVFPVVEAILVVILVLTAILFFTSVQRPTTGSDSGGIDLGQVAGDTLRIVQLRPFPVTIASGDNAPYRQGVSPCPATGACTMTFEMWLTNLAAGDGSLGTGATAHEVDEFLAEVLPTGARYSLRLSNGVASMQILPQGPTEAPHGATASEVMFLPNWAPFRANVPTSPAVPATPGQTITAASHPVLYDWTDPASTIECIKAPTGPSGSSTRPDGDDAGVGGDTWLSAFQATPGKIPFDAPFGTWAAYTDAGCSLGVEYAKIVRDPTALRMVSDGTTSNGALLPDILSGPATRVTSTAAVFSDADEGKSISGGSIPAGTTITDWDSANPTWVTISNPATLDATGVTLTIGLDNPYPAYGLQLVVWFGA